MNHETHKLRGFFVNEQGQSRRRHHEIIKAASRDTRRGLKHKQCRSAVGRRDHTCETASSTQVQKWQNSVSFGCIGWFVSSLGHALYRPCTQDCRQGAGKGGKSRQRYNRWFHLPRTDGTTKISGCETACNCIPFCTESGHLASGIMCFLRVTSPPPITIPLSLSNNQKTASCIQVGPIWSEYGKSEFPVNSKSYGNHM